jgi:cellulose synthase/poly-beta-1,6-N-acetylglucosamine synthase-like glycosyltransferase
MLNLLMRENKKTSDITILTDANVMFKAGTLYELVKYFKDSQVGLVDSKFVLSSQIISHEEEKDYLNFEQQLKYYEGLVWGTMQGPFGACYAIRTSLFHPIPEKFLVDDFFIGMNVMIQGFHAILNPNALVMEEVHTNWKQEFKRKMRISSGNYQNLDFFAKVLFKPFTGLSITWFFHKVLRWLLPVAFVPILVIDLIAFLFWGYSLIPSLITLILILGVVSLHYILQRLNLHSRTIERLSYFIYINLALVQGFIFFIKGIQTNVWKPTQRK